MTAPAPPQERYRPEALIAFAEALLARSGMPADKAADVAAILVEGDCLGKVTHGLALLPHYLREIETGGMAVEGGPSVVHDQAACLTWDGRKLPGPWLVLQAIDEAIARAKQFGIGAVSLQRSHHTACLGAYLRRATDQGYLLLLTLTDPGHASVAPFGGVTPVLTSNPIAFGAPTGGPPILIDMSTAMLTNAIVAGYQRRGEILPHPDLMDNQGRPSRDPSVIATTPPGSILPLGGLEAGHKGFSIGLMVELLSGCLSGRGRAEPNEGWSAAVFLLALDPAAFGGREAYLRQVARLAQACRASAPRPGFGRVTLPGEAALERHHRQMHDGVPVSTALIGELSTRAKRFDIAVPTVLPGDEPS
jgi:L-lactate dehydrogenase